MEIIHDRAAAQVEQILALAAIAGATALPMADTGQRMLDRHTLAQFGPADRGVLALAQPGSRARRAGAAARVRR